MNIKQTILIDLVFVIICDLFTLSAVAAGDHLVTLADKWKSAHYKTLQ